VRLEHPEDAVVDLRLSRGDVSWRDERLVALGGDGAEVLVGGRELLWRWTSAYRSTVVRVPTGSLAGLADALPL
jgi:hypothetical protein